MTKESGWFKRLLTRTKQVASSPEVAKRLELVERAIQLQQLGLVQAEVDGKVSEAAAGLIKALDGTNVAAIQLHSLIIVKFPGADGHAQLFVRTLTTDQLLALEKNPLLLKTPRALIDWALGGCPSSTEGQIAERTTIVESAGELEAGSRRG